MLAGSPLCFRYPHPQQQPAPSPLTLRLHISCTKPTGRCWYRTRSSC